jgi:hypothetical protein
MASNEPKQGNEQTGGVLKAVLDAIVKVYTLTKGHPLAKPMLVVLLAVLVAWIARLTGSTLTEAFIGAGITVALSTVVLAIVQTPKVIMQIMGAMVILAIGAGTIYLVYAGAIRTGGSLWPFNVPTDVDAGSPHQPTSSDLTPDASQPAAAAPHALLPENKARGFSTDGHGYK